MGGTTLIHILDNGITCILNNNSCSNSVTINIYFKVGSRDENKKQEGLTHFIEHMFFKGTKKRSEPENITQEIDEIGGYINANTSYDNTNYYIKIQKDDLEKGIELLSDMLFHSLFRPKDITSEKSVVNNELIMRLSNINVLISEMLMSLIYEKTTLEHSIGGNSGLLNTYNREQIMDYIDKHYTGDNTFISISGNIGDIGKIKTMLNKYFSKSFNYDRNIKKSIKKSGEGRILYKNYQKIQKSVRFKNKVFPNITNTTISLGFPGFAYGDKNSYVMEVIHSLLGANMSSRLFKRVRGENGLVYNIKTDVDCFEDVGLLEIYYSTNPNIDHVNKTFTLIFSELNKLKTVKVKSNELSKAKGYLIGNMTIISENSDFIANSNASNYAYLGRLITIDEYKKNIKAVSCDDIKKLSNILFNKSKLNIAIVSPFDITLDQLMIDL